MVRRSPCTSSCQSTSRSRTSTPMSRSSTSLPGRSDFTSATRASYSAPEASYKFRRTSCIGARWSATNRCSTSTFSPLYGRNTRPRPRLDSSHCSCPCHHSTGAVSPAFIRATTLIGTRHSERDLPRERYDRDSHHYGPNAQATWQEAKPVLVVHERL